MGWCVDVSPARQVESAVRSSSQFLGKIQRRGPPEVGSGEEPTQLQWIFPPGFSDNETPCVIGSTWGLIDKMASYVDLTKNKSQ